MIYVPACGTSYFQPLDRYVFGAVKQQMPHHNPNSGASNRELYADSFRHMKKAMDNISETLINKAWDMDGLRRAFEELTNQDYREFVQDQLGENGEESDDANDPDYIDNDGEYADDDECIEDLDFNHSQMKTRSQKSQNWDERSFDEIRSFARIIENNLDTLKIDHEKLGRCHLRNKACLKKWFFDHRDVFPQEIYNECLEFGVRFHNPLL